jgi:ribosomal protein S18 acetylase RimI-like enzyme
MNDVAVTPLTRDDLAVAADLLARAYRDNPLTFALLGDDAATRLQAGTAIHRLRIASMHQPPLVARRDGRIVAVCGFDPPGGSRMSPEDGRQMLEALSRAGPDVVPRAQTMLAEFNRHNPGDRHWHLGPVGVDPDCQGLGIGSLLAQRFCEMIDARGAPAFLETDQEKNARLYAKFGFETVDHAPVLGVPMWFMLRAAARHV